MITRRSGRLLGVAATSLLAVVASSTWTSAAIANQGGRRLHYAQQEVARCLARHEVSEESDASFTVVMPSYRKLFPSGITGSMSVPAPGASSKHFDDLLLFFFRTDQLARQGQARLVSTFYFARGVPLAIALVLHIHGAPSAADVHRLNDVIGNVVVLWQYPRHHPAASNRVLNLCLAASRN